MRRIAALSALAAVLAGALALGAQATGGGTSLTVYSGRDERFVKPIFDRFSEVTGIELHVRYGDSAELAATLTEEGGRSPADVFVAQDAGALGAVASRGYLRVLPAATLRRVPKRFTAPGRRWVGVSGRARVVAYNTDAVRASELPKTIWGYTSPRWRGKVGLPPTNASFQAFVTAMRLRAGEDRTRDWLLALKGNDVKFFTGNSAVLSAVASREIEVGLVNHYYLYLVKEEQPDAPIANHFLQGEDPGALVSVAGVGILDGAEHEDDARRFVEFLVSTEGQRFYVDEAEEAEYPLIAGIDAKPGLPPLDQLEGPQIALDDLGPQLERTLELLNEVGLTT
jgi:iron(III) transport system substrate-binding protein